MDVLLHAVVVRDVVLSVHRLVDASRGGGTFAVCRLDLCRLDLCRLDLRRRRHVCSDLAGNPIR